jgi:hypothetical protein
LRGRRRRERLGTVSSVDALREMYGRKGLDSGTTADQGDLDLDAPVDGHALLDAGKAVHDVLVRRLDAERGSLAAEAGRLIEKHLGKRLDELDARWRQELARAAAEVRHLVAEAEERHAGELDELRDAVEALGRRHEDSLGKVLGQLAERPVNQISVELPPESIKVEPGPISLALPVRKTVKSIRYDPATGRPTGIEEVESDT